MDRRSRFRHRARTSESARATGPVGPSAAPEMPRLTAQAPPRGGAEAGESRGATPGDSAGAGPREKPRAGGRARPYRRPTPVAGCESTEGDG